MTRQILKLFTALGTVQNGAAFAVGTPDEKYGVWKLSKSGVITSFTAVLQGRMSPTQSWYTVATLTQADLDANGCACAEVQLFPEVRAAITAIVAAGTLDAWLME